MEQQRVNEILERLDKQSDLELTKLVKELLCEVNLLNNNIYKDELTQVYNRRILNDNISYDVLAMCDIDNFKEINDKYGHTIGDKILVEFSKELNSMVRNQDIVCRYGGDEFTILFKDCSTDDILSRIEDIREKVSALGNKQQINLTVSFGLSEYQDGKTLHDVIVEADKALYESKNQGKNRVTVFSKIKEKIKKLEENR